MSEGKVYSIIENGIGTITFFHPQSNSLPSKILTLLAEEITKTGKNPDVKVIVLKSEGEKAFCAGASFDELVAIDDKNSGTKFFSGFAGVINAMRKTPQFVIVRVHGKAVGGGVGIASAADYTFATEAAAVKLSELAVGIGPFVVGPAVERKIGTSAFCQLTIDATKWYNAYWAKEKGLFADVFKETAEMDKAIEELATQLSKSNPQAMKMLKEVFWKGTENWDELLMQRASMSGELVVSEFTRNAIAKFKQGAR